MARFSEMCMVPLRRGDSDCSLPDSKMESFSDFLVDRIFAAELWRLRLTLTFLLTLVFFRPPPSWLKLAEILICGYFRGCGESALIATLRCCCIGGGENAG